MPCESNHSIEVLSANPSVAFISRFFNLKILCIHRLKFWKFRKYAKKGNKNQMQFYYSENLAILFAYICVHTVLCLVLCKYTFFTNWNHAIYTVLCLLLKYNVFWTLPPDLKHSSIIYFFVDIFSLPGKVRNWKRTWKGICIKCRFCSI